MVLNVIAAFLAGVSYYFVCVNIIAWGHDIAKTILTVLFMVICILDIISVLYLGVSINHIRKLINEKEL